MRWENLLEDVPEKWRIPFIRFVEKGEATAAFERELDTNQELQKAVDGALEAVSEGLAGLGETLKQVKAGNYKIDQDSFNLASRILSGTSEIKRADAVAPALERTET
jgi:hypothetical protein